MKLPVHVCVGSHHDVVLDLDFMPEFDPTEGFTKWQEDLLKLRPSFESDLEDDEERATTGLDRRFLL